MAWFRVQLTEEEQRIVNEERVAHPDLRVREKMLVLWLLHCGSTQEEAAKIVGISRTTVHRYVAAFRAGGLERPQAVQPPSPPERDGRLSRSDPKVLRGATGPHHRRGLRPHLSS